MNGPTAIKWFLASDGITPATDMSVALVGLASAGQGFYSTQLGCAFQFVWPATGAPNGAFGVQVSSDNVHTHYDDLSMDDASQAPTQPTGGADTTTIELPVGKWMSPYIRATYTPSSGGTGAVLTGTWTAK